MMGLDYVLRDRYVQTLWIKRTIAFTIDVILIAIVALALLFPLSLLNASFGFHFFISPFSFVAGVLYLLYSVILEGTIGATIGKQLMELRVLPTAEEMDVAKAFIRNLSKLWLPVLIVDVVIFVITDGDPRQRFMDRIAGTYVVNQSSNLVILPKIVRNQKPPPPYNAPNEWK